MLFNSVAYLIFLPITVALFWLIPAKWRSAALLLASYVFYMFWKPIYGVLILGLTALNYGFGFAIDRSEKNKGKWLALALTANLLVLGYFKYAFMTRDLINDVVKAVGLHQIPNITWEIILPLGISFFVFEFIHYLVDIYRGDKPVKSFIEFALFPSFFPTQIAGPIKRYQDFVPQLKFEKKLNIADFNQSIELIFFGLFKKVVLADMLGILVTRCYAHPEMLTGADFWLATWAFTFQVYFDFSGYTDIARGSALLFGIKVPANFNLPYLSGSYSEFWKRWHITLSKWLKDYLYIPLGGSRKGEVRTCINLVITMTLGGLWHGAAPHLVVWGFYVGVLLVLHRIWRHVVAKSRALEKIVETKAFHVFAIALTFNAHAIGLAMFRANNIPEGFLVIAKMFNLAPAAEGLANWQPAILNTNGSIVYPILPLVLAAMWVMQVVCSKSKEKGSIMPNFFTGFKPAYLAVLIAMLLIFSPDVTPSFIYFQF